MQYLAEENDPKNRLIQFSCANKAEAWPKASSDFASIFETITLIGPALFGAEWTGAELDAVNWPVSPRESHKLALLSSGGGAPGGARRGWSNPSKSIEFTLPREWTHQQNCHVTAWYVEKRQSKWEQNMWAKRRLREAVNWLAQRCRDGEIVSHARFRSGGGLWPMASWEWNLDDPLATFVSTGGHKRYFRELKATGPYEVYLFFKRAELAEAFDRLHLAPVIVPEADFSRLSPFIQLAVRLAREKKYYSKATSETQAVREAEVRAAWPLALPDVPMTQNTIQLVARMMGFPDSLAIQRGQRARQSGNRVEGSK